MPTILSHALPFALFVAVGAASDLLPGGLGPWADPLRVAAAGLALVVFGWRGAYPELKAPAQGDARATLLALGAGALIGLLWIPLTPEWLPQLGTRTSFDPAAAGTDAVPVLWTARLLGLVVVVPFAEELFVRSLVPRFVDADAEGGSWTDVPVGAFTARSAVVSIAFFTLVHPEWVSALVTGVLLTGLLSRTRWLGDAVLAHAVANFLLAAWVVLSRDTAWI